MSKLIAHEVEVASIDGRTGKQSNHFMESNASMNSIILVGNGKMPVHIGIYQSEYKCLVTHQSLVMAFAVRDGAFVTASVSHLPIETTGFPVFIPTFLDSLYPIVRNIHSQSEIESISSI